MAEPISIQQLKDASLDVKSLEEVVNGDENVVVTTRLGETYPSVKGSIKKVFENGGLPATPFETLAKMNTDGASLPNGSYAVVTNDNRDRDNGYYIKVGGSWVMTKFNPLKPVVMKSGDNADDLKTGIAFVSTTDGSDGVLNLPPLQNLPKRGTFVTLREGNVSYQKFFHYATLEQWERVGNGSSSNLVWYPWVKVIDSKDVKKIISDKISVNVFKFTNLTSEGADIYNATPIVEDGVNAMTLNEYASAVNAVFYTQNVDSNYIAVGDTLTLSADIFTDVVGVNGGDITLQALDSSGTVLLTSPTATGLKANEWHTITTSFVLPANTAKVKIRFVRRIGNTVVKYKNAVLQTSNPNSKVIINLYDKAASSATQSNTVYVKKTGNDIAKGTKTSPFLTIQRAVDELVDGGHIIVLDNEDYRESVTITTTAHVKISAIVGSRVNLFGSDKLTVTKTSGMTKVYQAPLTTKPVGMGGNRGKPAIFEWGTPSKPIIESERHFLQRGLTHRLPFTEMNEVATKAELDSVNGKWFWEAGIIYFTATDGSDATLKRYEARVRPVLTHSNGTIELVRVSTWFSSFYGMEFSGLATKRTACIAYGAYHNGFYDNANFTESYRDIAGGNGNDGFNGTVNGSGITDAEIDKRLDLIYFDPYGHDNGDDGISCHYRSDCTIYGGLFEYNTKADVVHVTGSNSVCYNTEARGTLNGFYVATDPTLDNERVKTVMRCVNTKSYNNGYAYIATSKSVLYCDNATAINPTIFGFRNDGTGAVYANDCKYEGDALKAKSGNVVVKNTSLLAP